MKLKNKNLMFYIKSILITTAMILAFLSVIAFGMIMLCVVAVMLAVIFIVSVVIYVKKYRKFPRFNFKPKDSKVYEGTYTEHDSDAL